MTASSRRMIELSFLALLDSGINYRGRKVGTFAAGTNAEALAHVRHIVLASIQFSQGLIFATLGPCRLPKYWDQNPHAGKSSGLQLRSERPLSLS